MTKEPFVLSATTLAKAYDLACPRFFIWSVDGIPRETVAWDETPGGKALAAFGNRHEDEVIKRLTVGAQIHWPSYAQGDLQAGAVATHDLLNREVDYIAQAVFVGEIVPGLVVRGIADLVRKIELEEAVYQIVEIKASLQVRTSQMLQAWVYGKLLSTLLESPGCDPVLVDRFHTPHSVPRRILDRIFTEFLTSSIPSWLEAGDAAFFRSGRCFSCPFTPECLKDAQTTRHLSLISGLGPGVASRLRGIGARDMTSLEDATKGALHPAGLESNFVRQLAGQARAFVTGSLMRTPDRTPLPRADVELFLEAEPNPMSSFPCRCGLLKRDRRKKRSAYRGVLLPGDEETAQARARAFLDLLAKQAVRAAREGASWQVLFFGKETGDRLSRLGEWAGWGRDLVEEILIKAVDLRSLVRRTWHLPVEHYDFSSVLDAVGLENASDDTPGFVLYSEWKEQNGEEAQKRSRVLLEHGEHTTRLLMDLWDWLTASVADETDG